MANQIKKICWASEMGDCEGLLEKEHVVSESLLRYFGTLGFTKNGVTRKFGIKKHVIRSLCAKHNRALGVYDEEARNFFIGWHKLWMKHDFDRLKTNERGQIILPVNGRKIERWLAKTFMNCIIFEAILSAHDDLTYYPSAQSLIAPIFNDEEFARPYGLYIIKPWESMYRSQPRTFNWSLKTQHEQVMHYHAEEASYRSYVLPTFIWIGFGGLEIIGVFNPTIYKDEFHRTCLEKYYSSFLPIRADYRHQKMGFNRDGDRDFGSDGPARIIEFQW